VKIFFGGGFEHDFLQESKHLNFSNIVTMHPGIFVTAGQVSTKLLKDIMKMDG